MAASRTAPGGARKHEARRTGAGTPPDRERRLVGVDPWALPLERLLEVPAEGAPVERKSDKGE